MKMFKRVISLLLVSCLLFCAVPSVSAAESEGTTATDEENILDNPIFSGAITEIVAAFVESLTEIFNRYVEIIKNLLLSLELPEMNIPTLPEVPGEGDDNSSVEGPADDNGEAEGDNSGADEGANDQQAA